MGQQSSKTHLSSSHHLEESQRLLTLDPQDVDYDGCFPPHGVDDLCPVNPWKHLPVYTTIHRYFNFPHFYPSIMRESLYDRD